MRRTVLVAVVLVMNVGGCDRPTVHAAMISSAAPLSTDTPSSTREEQAISTPGSQTAPDRPGPVPPPDLQGFPTSTAPNELATVALPNNFSDVTTLFDRLPPEVAGHTRSPQFDRISAERSTVGYGARPSGYRRLTLRGAVSSHQTGQVGTSSPLWGEPRRLRTLAGMATCSGCVTRHLSRLPDRLSGSRYTECCGVESTALGCSPSRPTIARIVTHCLPPLSLRPSLQRDSSPSRYPAGRPNPAVAGRATQSRVVDPIC